MVLIAVFGVALLIVVLVSGLAARSILSTSLLFLVAGALVGDGAFGLIHITADSPIVAVTADLALFAVLFTDGMHVSFPALRGAWRNPARALALGMPLAFVGMALITHFLVGLDWTTSFLVGAVLAPTDPVFASAIVGRKEVPARLRQLLNVESGINDGLALPVVLVLIAVAGPASGEAETSLSKIALELLGGLALGAVLPLVVSALVRFPVLGAEPKLQPLLPLATGVILYAGCHLTHANPYLAAFSAGAVLASVSPESGRAFEPLGEAVAELSKFAALLVFGALLTPRLFGDLSVGGYVAVVLAIVLVRPASLLISLIGTRFARREMLAAAWFGPKGFASVVYGLLVLQSGIPQGERAYTLIAVCIAFSIAAHSSTDVPVARLFDVEDLVGIPDDDDDGHDEGREKQTARAARTASRVEEDDDART
ncbi:cation:proton antiporter [Streptomyces antimycoticus]|uniref:Cation:proton antiporter n=2 Tax=Streptomyces violaceusniger group TaxID=2839105 RepID=A0ABD5J4B3_9ACTN|nr:MULTISPECIES: cation:proton antiporter [Streptomyces]MEE4583181.1 cation:proton antiporter [Streptomyces sp. DSM 41602]AJZ82047.1 cation:proton antiporter [Streptomyces sp. AgN23]KUL56077.1 peptidase [Streptomyces violaceusniger]RSS47969.1 sodium:proton antiporter [Streptomyces sp. WAC05858]WTA80205.1 cation:proton antiporter [Streptomyces antimycoticus]